MSLTFPVSSRCYSFVGPVRVRFETADDLQTGRFRVRSAVIRGDTVKDGEIIKPVTDHPRRGSVIPGRPRLLLSPGGAAADGSLTAQGAQQAYELTSEVTLLGRGTDCDLRLVDNGVSRHHAEIRLEGNEAILVDIATPVRMTYPPTETLFRIPLQSGTITGSNGFTWLPRR